MSPVDEYSFSSAMTVRQFLLLRLLRAIGIISGPDVLFCFYDLTTAV